MHKTRRTIKDAMFAPATVEWCGLAFLEVEHGKSLNTTFKNTE